MPPPAVDGSSRDPVLGTALVAPPARDGAVDITDVPAIRTHHPGDLMLAILAALGVVVVMLLATYAQHTTTGVAEDVRGFATLLRAILFVPVGVLTAAVIVLAPVAVLTELSLRRKGRQVLLTVAAAAAAAAVNAGITWAIVAVQAHNLQDGLSVWLGGAYTMTLPTEVALLAGLLTLAGPHDRRRTVRWSWNLLWVVIGVLLITAQVSLPGVAISLLVGRGVGLVARYLGGVEPEQAYGRRLAAGVRRAGIVPRSLVRVPDAVTDDADPPLPLADPARAALARTTKARVYALRTTDDRDLDLVVVDGDRQVIGTLGRVWRSLRLRGIDGRRVVSLRQAAERSALLGYAALAAGVRTPRLLSMSEVDDSMLLVAEHPGGAVPLADLPDDQVTDDLLVQIWEQLGLAHAAGIAHRALTSDVILVDREGTRPVVWLTGWDSGDVASNELARRIDQVQLIALIALRVGATRALDSAAHVLDTDAVATIGTMLQTIALPRQTREQMRAHKRVLADLRTAIVARLPEADMAPHPLVRFGARTLLMVALTAVALIVLMVGLNVEQIGEAFASADWRWALVAFALGLLTLVGAAMALVAFSPVKIGLWRATQVQTAATFVGLAAPAGIGPAALNLRALTQRGASGPVATATVALVQVSQIVVTVVLLLALSLVSGGAAGPMSVSPAMLVVIAAVAALVGIALLVPQVRAWVAARTLPTLRQTWPRLVDVLGQPWRLAMGIAGNAITTVGYVLAFAATLQALGQHRDLLQVTVVYLAGNTAGALVPTPGGIVAIEGALTTGLTGIGLNLGVATSVAVLFRVLTYWSRIPLGWIAMRRLQRRGEL
ncbi:MAG: flippase-like domain-containing protein [Micrococcales bacterium]|nr:flippase-like domain-containing protein [Micrococcales bacterium]